MNNNEVTNYYICYSPNASPRVLFASTPREAALTYCNTIGIMPTEMRYMENVTLKPGDIIDKKEYEND